MELDISIVRSNIIKDRNYSPYCGGDTCKTMPRTVFNGKQFICPSCGWESSFPEEFINKYKKGDSL